MEKLLEETIKLAERIGTHSPLIVKLAKQAVNQAYETTLKSGLQFEKSTFYGTFATVSLIFIFYTPKYKVVHFHLMIWACKYITFVTMILQFWTKSSGSSCLPSE